MKKIIFAIISLLIATSSCFAFSSKDANNCVANFPENWSSDLIWDGSCKNGLAHGKAKITMSGFSPFVVSFINGELNGLVELKRKDFFYQCNFNAGKKTSCEERRGKEQHTFTNYDSDGAALDGHGYMELLQSSSNGDTRVEGNFFRGKLNGFGKLTWARKYNNEPLIQMMANGKGKSIGSKLQVVGLWEDGNLILLCNSEQECSIKRMERNTLDHQVQLCEAQKSTCLSQCGSNYGCTMQCNNISCNGNQGY